MIVYSAKPGMERFYSVSSMLLLDVHYAYEANDPNSVGRITAEITGAKTARILNFEFRQSLMRASKLPEFHDPRFCVRCIDGLGFIQIWTMQISIV